MFKNKKKKVRRRDFCLVPWFITLPEQSLPVRFKDYSLDENKGAEQVRALPASVLGRHFWTSIRWVTTLSSADCVGVIEPGTAHEEVTCCRIHASYFLAPVFTALAFQEWCIIWKYGCKSVRDLEEKWAGGKRKKRMSSWFCNGVVNSHKKEEKE